jgi:GT2 family glycosyltransferase
MERMPTVATVILNSFEHIVDWASLKRIPFILIDETEQPSDPLPDLTIVRSKRNYGFSGGMNLGIYHASRVHPQYYWLLNNDTLVEPKSLDLLVKSAAMDPSIGLISPVITYHSKPHIVWYGGGSIDYIRLWPIHWHLNQPIPPVTGVQYVTFVTGCAPLIRSDCIREIGLLDDSLFFRHEDVEYSIRAYRRGWRLAVSYDARVSHKLGRSIGRSENPVIWYYDNRNRLYLALRIIGFPKNLPFLTFFTLTRLGNILRCLLSGRATHLRGAFLGVRDALRGSMGPAPNIVTSTLRQIAS